MKTVSKVYKVQCVHSTFVTWKMNLDKIFAVNKTKKMKIEAIQKYTEGYKTTGEIGIKTVSMGT